MLMLSLELTQMCSLLLSLISLGRAKNHTYRSSKTEQVIKTAFLIIKDVLKVVTTTHILYTPQKELRHYTQQDN